MLQKQKNYVKSKIDGRPNIENIASNNRKSISRISQGISNSKGITLVALVITVILMLILAGVAISNITGENGIIEKTKQASDKYNNAAQKEAEMLNSYIDSIYTVYEINYAKVSFAYEPSNWTNGEVKVSLINTLEERGYTSEYSIDNGVTWNKYTTPISINNNSTVILGRLVKLGLTGEITTGNVANIDKVAPKAFTPTQSNITENSFTITASTTDGDTTTESGISGIKEYVYYIKKSTDSTYTNETIVGTETNKIYTNLLQNTTYNIYVEAIDKAGNKTKSEEISVTTGEIPDLTASNVTFTYTPDTWTNTSVQVGITTTIEGYTLQYSANEGNTWANYTSTINISNNNTVILARLYKDGQTGGIATGNVANIDKVAPKAFTPTQSNITENSFTITASTTDGDTTTESGISGIKEYVYYIKKSTDSTYTNTTQTGTTKTYTGLTDGTTYNIYVEAIDNAGNKTISSTINVATKLSVPPEESQIIGDGSFSTTMGVNTPKLAAGMEPVVIGANGSTSKPTTEKQWYDYSISSKRWANAKTADGSLWVWIPRYAYKITSNLGVGSEGISGTIDVVFVDINNKNGSTTYSTTYPSVSGNAMTNFVVHPAFVNNTTNGGWSSNIPGFWVAKFEAGYAGGNNSVTKKATGLKYTQNGSNTTVSNFYGTGQTDIHYPVFMGKTYSYNYINVGDMFRLSRALTNSGNPYGFNSTNVDSHLMKNSEWGAVTYLSHSKYGVNGADTVYINNVNINSTVSTVYGVTGYAGTSVNAGTNKMTTTTLGDIVLGVTGVTGSATSYAWYTTNGQMASSNNNITGVYDLSGGLREYTSGYVNNGNSNLNTYGGGLVSESDLKYKRVYPVGSSDSGTNNYNAYTGYGDAIKETSGSDTGSKGWNWDTSAFPNTSHPFFYRGGGYDDFISAGMFQTNYNTGNAYGSVGFRACVVVGSL